MSSSIEKLLGKSSEGLGEAVTFSDAESQLLAMGISPRRAAELASIYSLKNGIFAFETALWIYELDSKQTYSIQNINDIENSKTYDLISKGGICFGSDAIGNQFVVDSAGYWLLDMEVGETEFISDSLLNWATEILEDIDYRTCYPYAHDWQKSNGALKKGTRLGAKVPFILGGDFDAENLYDVDIVKLIQFRIDLFNQIKDTPAGTQIEIRTIE